MKTTVDLEDLILAFTLNADESYHFLNSETGEILHLTTNYAATGFDDSEELDRISSDDRYLSLDTISSKEAYQFMVDFVNQLEDGRMKEILGISIQGKGAFRRFKDTLFQDLDTRDHWFEFEREKNLNYIEDWFTNTGYKIERSSKEASQAFITKIM